MTDRGEGHPANAATDVPAAPVPATVVAGLVEMAEKIRPHRIKTGARLVCEHGPGVVEALRPWSRPGPVIMPDPRPGEDWAPGQSYLQVEFSPVASLGPGGWRLLRDGEIVADGVLGVCQDGAEEAP
jgi:hypothetical protein